MGWEREGELCVMEEREGGRGKGVCNGVQEAGCVLVYVYMCVCIIYMCECTFIESCLATQTLNFE